MIKSVLISLIISILLVYAGCGKKFTPKPSGYSRIDFPEKKYVLYDSTCPYKFEYPVYGKITNVKEAGADPCWINVEFPGFNGKIYLSYFHLHNNLAKYSEESRTLAYKHTIKAESIDEKNYVSKSKKVYGIVYDIKGNTASSVNFVLTDSTSNFIRGALYFNSKPNKDSLAPVINFFRQDIDHLIETFEWK